MTSSSPATVDAAPGDRGGVADEDLGRGTVIVRGLEGPIGERIAARLADLKYQPIDANSIDTSSAETTQWVGGTGPVAIVDALVADYDLLGALGLSPVVEIAKTVDIAVACGVEHLVVVSSAMVYGAQPNNPLPITEDAVLRPSPDFDYPSMLAAAEELVEGWRREGAKRVSAVLRLAVPVSERHSSSLARALSAGLGQQQGVADPPAQFVHLDDAASAAVVAVERRLDGVFNVAPDGWIAGDRLPALSGNRPRIKLPARLAEVVTAVRWRFQRGPIPPGLRPYMQHSWVVANDKLRQQGWAPTITNEEAFVEGTEAPWWSMITPKRRQELALGSLVAMVVGVILVVFGTAGWWKRRR